MLSITVENTADLICENELQQYGMNFELPSTFIESSIHIIQLIPYCLRNGEAKLRENHRLSKTLEYQRYNSSNIPQVLLILLHVGHIPISGIGLELTCN